MNKPVQECPDLDRLLRLIGILGPPTEEGNFWKYWRPGEDGYGFKKIKGCITGFTRPSHDHRWVAHDFADYVLMLFATGSPEEESKLADLIGRHISTGEPRAVGIQFLADLRSTAWNVWRDHHSPDAATVIQQWSTAPLK
ncbi:hypothetical protein [Streptomyces rochei]|uniref:hypothetical protein n=1 Tax=Streptomyces rochei TaxID=1928 RepID=UPI0036852965